MKNILLYLAFTLTVLENGYAQVISPYIAGQNAWMPAAFGNNPYYGKLDQLWPMVKASKVKMIRIGGNGVEFHMPTKAQYIALIDSIRSIGAEPMVQVPVGRGLYTAQQAADIVNHVNNVMGRNVKYWIIGNEPNLQHNDGRPAPVNAAGVAAYTKAWSTAMKLKDPSILIVGPECAFYDSNYYPALVGGASDITGKDEYGRYYVDIISFHSYAFSGAQTRDQVINSPNGFANNVNSLLSLMTAANTKHGRTGNAKLQWALTEFNVDWNNPTPTSANSVQGVGVHSFLNGQYWLSVINIAMQKGALSAQPWSIHEGGGGGDQDLGYIAGNGTSKPFKERSSYYHLKLLSENVKGNYLPATDNDDLVTAFGSVFNDTTSIVILNQRSMQNFDFKLQLSTAEIPGAEGLEINLSAGINALYTDRIDAQSTMVLRFDSHGNLLRKIVYSVTHAANEVPPTYVSPEPYLGTAAPIPGLIKAVEFDKGGMGIAYQDADVANQGALLNPLVPRADESVDTEAGGEGLGNIGYTADGEWLLYSLNIQRTGLYKVTARIASQPGGGSFRLRVNGVDKTGVIPVPQTASWTTYQNLVIDNVYLEAATNAVLKFEVVTRGFNTASFTFAEQNISGIVVNRVYNGSNDGTGRLDAVELLVINDNLDIRGVVVKDFETNNTADNGGKYRFNAIPFWQNLRSGTTIVLRKLEGGTGYVQDTNAADFTVDLLLENTAYVTNESSGNIFNITQTDMVVIKTGVAAGVDGAIHAFATRGGGANGVPSAIYNSVTSPKLVSPNTDAGGDPSSMHYPLNPTMASADYNGSAAAISKSTTRTWGFGFGAGNTSYIQSLRNEALNSQADLRVTVSGREAAREPGQEVTPGDESIFATTLSAYPNPTSGLSKVVFNVVNDESLLFLDLYDFKGVKVRQIYAGNAKADETYSFDVDASNIPAGIYLLRLSSPRVSKTFKVALK